MKKCTLILVLLMAGVFLQAQDIPGHWAGYLHVQGVKLKIVFHIKQFEGKLTTTFDSPDQNVRGLKVDETTLVGNEVTLNAKSLGITYKGNVNNTGDSIHGFWIQGSGKFDLVLGRITEEVINKPTNPYETAIVLSTPSGEINGTLTMPDQTTSVPVVLIIAGSGPTDRDGNSPPSLKNNSNCYKILAESLRNRGIASVRYDKRGIAGSVSAALKESNLRIENYIEDVVGWIDLLKKDPRFSKIILAGHSEGSLIGMMACKQDQVDGFISISGSGRPADEILKEQFSGLSQVEKDQIFPVLDKLKKGDTVGNIPKNLYVFFRPGIQPYLISWLKYNPAVEIKKLKLPVLIIQGDMDIQVSVEDARLLSNADPDAELKIIPGMNHVLKDTDTKDKMEQVTRVYTNSDLPINKTFEDEVVQFIKNLK